MKTIKELQQKRICIVKASEGSFENQVDRLLIRLGHATNEYILSQFKCLRSVDADYEYYLACLVLDPQYVKLT